jgi:hypothetical protein
MPANFERPVSGGDYARLPVAWGLSLEPTEIGTIMPPSVIEDISPRRVLDFTGSFTSKDQV